MKLFVYFFVLTVHTAKTLSHDVKGFDDTILFNINWPGSKADVSDLANAEFMIVQTSHKEKYKCFLPNVQEKEQDNAEKYEGPSPLQLIAPLFTQTACSYRLESYWTYEVCHGRYIRQYHEDREGKKVKLQEYILGRWDVYYYEKLISDIKKKQPIAKDEVIPYKKIDGVNLPYFEVVMENGTLCDLNQNKPRQTRVLYVCYIHGKHEIYSLKETSTCQYEIVVLSPLLCGHPKYKAEETGENDISCIPLENSPDKPHNLLKMKAESLKLRKRSDNDQIRIEFVPLDLHEKEDVKPLAETPIDPSPVKSFLSGKNCLNGGTGWWKYEFCYGKSVEQYHVEKDGRKTSLNLGMFDKQKHLSWLEQNPHKKPKPLGMRSQLSHFYSGGTICDKTGKPRQTEVKLKCLENSPSINAVSLYLLEPRYCEYILGVESPLICDILAKADDNGLVDIPNDFSFENDIPL